MASRKNAELKYLAVSDYSKDPEKSMAFLFRSLSL
jgi:hypothetical protein